MAHLTKAACFNLSSKYLLPPQLGPGISTHTLTRPQLARVDLRGLRTKRKHRSPCSIAKLGRSRLDTAARPTGNPWKALGKANLHVTKTPAERPRLLEPRQWRGLAPKASQLLKFLVPRPT